MDEKQVDALLIFGSNPAYTAPADVPFKDELKNVGFTFHLGTHQDETAVLCEWHVPEAHYLEAWGDIRGHDGTVAIQQPLIAPLYGGKSTIELLADITAAPGREGQDIVRGYWRNSRRAEEDRHRPETFWQEWVRAGVVAETAARRKREARRDQLGRRGSPAPPPPGAKDLEINFRADPTSSTAASPTTAGSWSAQAAHQDDWDNAVYTGGEVRVDAGRDDVDATVVEADLEHLLATTPTG